MTREQEAILHADVTRVAVRVEVGYTINQDSKSSGLPGRYVLGAIYDSSDYEKFSDPNVNEDGNYGFYGIAEQMVYREGAAGSDEGLTAWASVTFSPEDDINTLPVGVFAGANYKGLIDGRDDDVTAFGVYYGLFSDDLPGQNSEVVFELNYRVQVAPSTYITPDIQYVLNPNGGGIQDALVLGFEASIDF
ncbi:MAG: carbohydrate porin [Pseudomonadota bacterium]